MGYTLVPRNKKVDEIDIGAFSWPIVLQETGAGYLLGYGAGLSPSTYVYQTGNHGSPASNDGYIVTASEARAMGKMARGWISVKEFVNADWDKMPEDERRRKEEWNKRNKIYQSYTGEKFMNIVKKFADFAEACGGFRIT